MLKVLGVTLMHVLTTVNDDDDGKLLALGSHLVPWAGTSCPSSIHWSQCPCHTIPQCPSCTWCCTCQGSCPRSSRNQCSSFRTSIPRWSSLNRKRSEWHRTPQSKSCERRCPHQTPALILPWVEGSLPCSCPGTSCPSSSRLSRCPCRTSPQSPSCSSLSTLHSNHPTRSPG